MSHEKVSNDRKTTQELIRKRGERAIVVSLAGGHNSCRAPLDGKPRAAVPHSIFSVRGRGTDFFNDYSDANGCGLFDLDQRIGDVDIGDKDGAAESARGIDGIGGRGIDLFDVMTRSSDSDARR